MWHEKRKDQDQYSHHQETIINQYGTSPKAKMSGKREGELYQQSLQESQRTRDQEQKNKIDQQSSNKLPSQKLSEELRGILQTRQQFLERPLSQQDLSSIGKNIFQYELHSSDDKLRNLYKEINHCLDKEKGHYSDLITEDNNTRNEIRQLEAEKKLKESPKGYLKDLAEACHKYSVSQGVMLNDLQQQINIAEKFASLGFNNSIPIENLKNMQKDIVESRKRTIEEGQNSLKEWKKSREIIGEIENNLKEAKKLEIKHIHTLRESERNIRIYTNLARSLETIPNSNLQPEKVDVDMNLETDRPQKPKDIVKAHMLEAIKNAYKECYIQIWNRVVRETGQEPFFRWHGEIKLYAYELVKKVENETVKKTYVTHDPGKLGPKIDISSAKLRSLKTGDSYNGITSIRIKDIVNPSEAIYDINYKFVDPHEFSGKPLDKQGVYFTNNRIETYIEVLGIKAANQAERTRITVGLSTLYSKTQRGTNYYYATNSFNGFKRCRELET